MLARPVERIKFGRVVAVLAAAVGLVTCGPPLTDPSPDNITGHWIANTPVGAIHDLTMTIDQAANGDIGGAWSATLSPANAPCPPGLPASPNGPLTGSYTLVGIGLSITGIGFFHGQKISPTEFRGSLQSCDAILSVTFSLSSPGGG